MLAAGDLALVSVALGLGFLIEAVAGFGGTVVALSLGARWFPIEQLLAWFLPLNLVLSSYLVVRHRRHVAGRLLARRILPAMLAGLAVGTAIAPRLDARHGAAVFAAIVVAVAAFELARLASGKDPGTLPAPAQAAVLAIAGVVHGLFATGGPLAVAVASRALPVKAALRATLAVLWLVLNAIVTARLAATGVLDADTLATSALLAPALVAGIALGEAIHGRVPERPFRWLVAALLGVVGALLLVSPR